MQQEWYHFQYHSQIISHLKPIMCTFFFFLKEIYFSILGLGWLGMAVSDTPAHPFSDIFIALLHNSHIPNSREIQIRSLFIQYDPRSENKTNPLKMRQKETIGCLKQIGWGGREVSTASWLVSQFSKVILGHERDAQSIVKGWGRCPVSALTAFAACLQPHSLGLQSTVCHEVLKNTKCVS